MTLGTYVALAQYPCIDKELGLLSLNISIPYLFKKKYIFNIYGVETTAFQFYHMRAFYIP